MMNKQKFMVVCTVLAIFGTIVGIMGILFK